MERTSTGGNRWAVLAAAAVVVVVAGIGVIVVNRDNDDSNDEAATEAHAGVPTEVLTGPGTELGDGLEVAVGSSLIGPVVVTDVDESQAVASWFAVVLVEADAVDVWRAYADQLAGLFPDTGIPDGPAPGCAPDVEDAEHCRLVGHGSRRAVDMSLLSTPGDVTGRYLLHLRGMPLGEAYVDDDEITSGPDQLPDPHPARERPGVGEPLAPLTTAYEGNNEEYVVVEGSELLAQFGDGSNTGGFDVMLRVAPTADLQTVVDAYVTQATQYDDTLPPPDVIEHQGTTVTVYHPPGGAGGYSGEVTVVDRPEGDDFVVFELSND